LKSEPEESPQTPERIASPGKRTVNLFLITVVHCMPVMSIICRRYVYTAITVNAEVVGFYVGFT
jgi:hypothetical protein